MTERQPDHRLTVSTGCSATKAKICTLPAPPLKAEDAQPFGLRRNLLAYENGACTLHSRIKVRVTKALESGETVTANVESTVIAARVEYL